MLGKIGVCLCNYNVCLVELWLVCNKLGVVVWLVKLGLLCVWSNCG